MTAHGRNQRNQRNQNRNQTRSRKPLRGGSNEVSINYGGENINYNMIQPAALTENYAQHFNRILIPKKNAPTFNVTRKQIRPQKTHAAVSSIVNRSSHATNLSRPSPKPSHFTKINAAGNSKAHNASRRLYRNNGRRKLNVFNTVDKDELSI